MLILLAPIASTVAADAVIPWICTCTFPWSRNKAQIASPSDSDPPGEHTRTCTSGFLSPVPPAPPVPLAPPAPPVPLAPPAPPVPPAPLVSLAFSFSCVMVSRLYRTPPAVIQYPIGPSICRSYFIFFSVLSYSSLSSPSPFPFPFSPFLPCFSVPSFLSVPSFSDSFVSSSGVFRLFLGTCSRLNSPAAYISAKIISIYSLKNDTFSR